LRDAEQRYDTHDAELLAIVEGFRELRHYCVGGAEPVEVLTDHNNLRYFQTTKRLNGRQARWSQELSAYDFEISHRPGKENPADGFSRRPDYMEQKIDSATQLLPTLQRKLQVGMLTEFEDSEEEWSEMREKPDWGKERDRDLERSEDALFQADDWANDDAAKFQEECYGLVEEPMVHLSSRQVAEIAQREDSDRGVDEEPEALLNLVRKCQEADPWVVRGSWKDFLLEERGVTRRPWAKDVAGVLRFEGAAFVPKDQALRAEILTAYHDMPDTGGHLGFANTLHNVRRNFFWPTMRQDIFSHCRDCDICQRSKPVRHKPYGTLTQPPMPSRPMKEFSMDFITGLPAVEWQGRTVDMILVIVDRFSRYAFYFPCNSEMTAEELADLWVNRLGDFGPPTGIITDRGSLFTSKFWTAWCYAMKIRRRLSTAFHPQTDGQTERQNQALEHFLRCYVNERMDDWPEWLAAAQAVYNHKVHNSLNQTPFVTVFGDADMELPSAEVDEAPEKVDAVEWRMTDLTVVREQCQFFAAAAKLSQAHHANKKLTPQTFEVGQEVILSTKNIKTKRVKKKLDFKWIGPFKVLDRVGSQAYRLSLPAQYPIHDVFHVSLLEPYRSRPGCEPPPPQEIDGDLEWNVEKVVDMRMKGRSTEYKVRWEGWTPAHDSWEPASNLANAKSAIAEYSSSLQLKKSVAGKRRGETGEIPVKRGPGRPPKKK
jgi:transposase InsO family protein